MRLVTVQRPGRLAAGIELGGDILDLGAAVPALPDAGLLPGSVRGLLAAGDAALELARRIADKVADAIARQAALAEHLRVLGALAPRRALTLAAPIPDPAIVLSCGMNYRAHLEEMKTPVPATPTAFTKSVASLIGPESAILLPRANPDMVDWEGEFCAVIGRPCHAVAARDALDYVAGYTLINDVSARDWVAPIFSATGIMGPILAWEHNVLGKQFPTFCPMGPVLVTRDEIADPDMVTLETRLNDTVMQSARTDDLVFGVAAVIAWFSRFYRFLPGDVISTGSPAGVGYGREPKLFMRPGDRIAVSASGIGTLANPIAAA